MALSLYRKYRPNVFTDVVGQEHVIKTLANAVEEGSIAHAYLFCGPRGTGKTTTARLLAKALLCENGPTAQPCGTCLQCADIAQGTHPDVYELDAASRTGVENVREEIISRVQFAPTRGSRKIYIIDEVHMLSVPAFNALLKTLEEPPEHVVFVMCTTDPQKVLETVQSRCQRFDFHRFSIEEIVTYLQRICEGEGFTFEQEALELIAAKANGGMRDATTALEQVAVSTSGAVTLNAARGQLGQLDASGLFKLCECIAARDAAKAFQWVDFVVTSGIDLVQCAHDLAAHLRNLYVTALTGGGNGIVACPSSDLPRYQQQAQKFGGPERLSRALTVCGELCNEMRGTTDARLSFEIALTRLCRAESDLTIEALAERIESLEQGIPAPKVVGVAYAPADAVAEVAPVPQATEPATEKQAAPVQHSFGAAAVEQLAAEKAPEPEPAPEPVPEPTPQPKPASAPAQGMSIARVFAAVLTEVKKVDVATAALLNGVELTQDAAGYHLNFPQGSDFAMRLASKGEAHELLAAAFKNVVGEGTLFDCRKDETSQPAAVRKPSFETVSAVDAAAPVSFAEDGYDAAQEAYADMAAYADAYEDPGYAPAPEEPVPAVSYEEAVAALPKQQAAEADFDPLSVFGGGIHLEEI